MDGGQEWPRGMGSIKLSQTHRKTSSSTRSASGTSSRTTPCRPRSGQRPEGYYRYTVARLDACWFTSQFGHWSKGPTARPQTQTRNPRQTYCTSGRGCQTACGSETARRRRHGPDGLGGRTGQTGRSSSRLGLSEVVQKRGIGGCGLGVARCYNLVRYSRFGLDLLSCMLSFGSMLGWRCPNWLREAVLRSHTIRRKFTARRISSARTAGSSFSTCIIQFLYRLLEYMHGRRSRHSGLINLFARPGPVVIPSSAPSLGRHPRFPRYQPLDPRCRPARFGRLFPASGRRGRRVDFDFFALETGSRHCSVVHHPREDSSCSFSFSSFSGFWCSDLCSCSCRSSRSRRARGQPIQLITRLFHRLELDRQCSLTLCPFLPLVQFPRPVYRLVNLCIGDEVRKSGFMIRVI